MWRCVDERSGGLIFSEPVHVSSCSRDCASGQSLNRSCRYDAVHCSNSVVLRVICTVHVVEECDDYRDYDRYKMYGYPDTLGGSGRLMVEV